MIAETSRAAKKRSEEHVESQSERMAIALLWPGTREEAAGRAGIKLQTACGLVLGLIEEHLAEETGELGTTKSGSRAKVVQLTDEGVDWVEGLLQ